MKKLLLALLLSQQAFCADVEDIFEQAFYNNYTAGQCAVNSKSFLGQLAKEGSSVEKFWFVKIENKGFSMTGLVNAEKARDLINGESIAKDKNWYYHAFVLDENLNVFDFDYGIMPEIIPLEDYLYSMFLDEDDQFNNRYFTYTKPENKIKDYELHWHSVEKRENSILEYELVKVESFNDFLKNPVAPTVEDDI